MFRGQMINFMEATVVLLTLTNAVSAVAAAYAISIAGVRTRLQATSPRPVNAFHSLSRIFGSGR